MVRNPITFVTASPSLRLHLSVRVSASPRLRVPVSPRHRVPVSPRLRVSVSPCLFHPSSLDRQSVVRPLNRWRQSRGVASVPDVMSNVREIGASRFDFFDVFESFVQP